TNESQVSPTVYQFDLYLLNTGTQAFEYAGGQWGISINPAVSNGGTLTATVIKTASQFTNTSQTPTNVSLPSSTYSFNIAPKLPPGNGNGSVISNTTAGCSSPGTRVATFKI